MNLSVILRISAYVKLSIPHCSTLALNFMSGNFSASGNQMERNKEHEMIELVDVSILWQRFAAILRFHRFLRI